MAGLESRPEAMPPADETLAIQRLAEKLRAGLSIGSAGRADWLRLRANRYYETDLLELTHVLALAVAGNTCAFANSRRDWKRCRMRKGAGTRRASRPTTCRLERIFQPSRWLTFEAVHTLMLIYGGNTYAVEAAPTIPRATPSCPHADLTWGSGCCCCAARRIKALGQPLPAG